MANLLFQSKKCFECGGITTKIRHREHWHYNLGKDKPLCHKCYNKLIWHPRQRKKPEYWAQMRRHNEKQNKVIFRFKNRWLVGTFRELTGFCSHCPNNMADGSCKTTHMHHELGYFIIFPWFGRIELCAHCHARKGNN